MTANVDILNALFGGRGRTGILRLLASQATPLTGRQVAELTGLSPLGASRALSHLAGLGVVSRRRVGSAITHELQRDSLLVQSVVLPALEAERGIRAGLEQELLSAFGDLAVSLVLFGSIVRNEAEPGSDIDVLIVTANQAQAGRAYAVADDAGQRFYRRFGMPLSVMVVTRAALREKPSPFLIDARDQGVLLKGLPLTQLMSRDG